MVVRGDVWDVAVEDGVVAAVGPELPGGREEIDARGLLVLPGMVDGHVHLDDPGRADWEGLGHRHRRARRGRGHLLRRHAVEQHPADARRRRLRRQGGGGPGRARVDFALWGGLVPATWRAWTSSRGGASWLQGVHEPERGPGVRPRRGGRPPPRMERAAALGLPVAVHAEDPAVLDAMPRGAGRTMMNWCASRPVAAEVSAVRIALDLARATGCAVHLVHLSSPEAVDLVAAARGGVDATCEACPHHLVLTRGDASRSAPRPSARRRYDRPPSGRACGRGSRAARSTWWARTTRPGRRS